MDSGKKVFRPFYRQLVEDILAKIQSGFYADGQILPSERELCLQYHLSRQTVRNALKLLAQQGWVVPMAGKGTSVQSTPRPPGAAGQNREGQISKHIGLICTVETYLSNTSTMETLMGLKGKLSQHGYSISLSVSKKDEEHQVTPVYPDWFQDKSMGGYICMSVHAALQRQLIELGVPVISLGYTWEESGLPCVALDFRSIYARAVRHLHDKGIKRICAIVGKEDSVFTREVLGGYDEGRLALNKSSSEVSTERFEDTAYDLIAALRRVLKAKPRPGGIILQGDDHIEEVMRFLASEGISVPKDLFVLAIQARPNVSKYIDQLGYFDYDVGEMARRTAEKLLEIIQDGRTDPPQELWDQGEFIDPTSLQDPLAAGFPAASAIEAA